MQLIGLGTIVNVVAIVIGSLVGLAVGDRLGERTRGTVTDALGLMTGVIGALSLRPIMRPTLDAAVGNGVGLMVVLLALMVGAMVGSALRIEDRMADLGDWAKSRLGRFAGERFTEGFVSSTLLFCVGPMAILGSLQDGLGQGGGQLFAKSILDGFAAIAFASALGIGVMTAAVSVGVYQGLLTLAGFLLGSVLPAAELDALTITGGVVLLGLSVRLLGLKQVRVADLLPSLVIAPALVWLAGLL